MDDDWKFRLNGMETWYAGLLSDPNAAQKALIHEYACHGPYLATLRGDILDVGGGAGLAARYLQADCRYVVVDPSESWRSEAWQSFGVEFCGERVPTTFVAGRGEELPFSDNIFDALTAFWSLNHSTDPHHCLLEMWRVAKLGASVLLVLEDMEPTWGDLCLLATRKCLNKIGVNAVIPYYHNEKVGSGLKANLRLKISNCPWPKQDDHIALNEKDLRTTISNRFEIVRRVWLGGFLTMQLRKLKATPVT